MRALFRTRLEIKSVGKIEAWWVGTLLRRKLSIALTEAKSKEVVIDFSLDFNLDEFECEIKNIESNIELSSKKNVYIKLDK